MNFLLLIMICGDSEIEINKQGDKNEQVTCHRYDLIAAVWFFKEMLHRGKAEK